MMQENMEGEMTRDRIAESVEYAIYDLVKREDPHFYDGTRPDAKVAAAIVIAGLKRTSEEEPAVEAVAHLSDRSAAKQIWKSIHEMASKVLADLEAQAATCALSGLTDA